MSRKHTPGEWNTIIREASFRAPFSFATVWFGHARRIFDSRKSRWPVRAQDSQGSREKWTWISNVAPFDRARIARLGTTVTEGGASRALARSLALRTSEVVVEITNSSEYAVYVKLTNRKGVLSKTGALKSFRRALRNLSRSPRVGRDAQAAAARMMGG